MKEFIKGIGLENFRVFKDNTRIDFAPITILTGTNSSGKSSVIRAVNLLKNYFRNREIAIDKKENPDILDIEETLDILGDYSKLPNNEITNTDIVFNFPIIIHGIVDTLNIKSVFSSKNDKLRKGKLSELSIFSKLKNENIFSVIEHECNKEKVSYKVSINYLYFFEQYKRESEQIKEYISFSDKLGYDKEIITKDEFDTLSKIHPLFFSFVQQTGLTNDSYKPFFDFFKDSEGYKVRTFYSDKDKLFEYSGELRSFKNISDIENEFLRKYQYQLDYYNEKYEDDIGLEFLKNVDFLPQINLISRLNLLHLSSPVGIKENKIGLKSISLHFKLIGDNPIITIKDSDNADNRTFSLIKLPTNELENADEKENNDGQEIEKTMSEFFFETFVFENLFESINNSLKLFNKSDFLGSYRDSIHRIFNIYESPVASKLFKKILELNENENNNEYLSFIDKYIQEFGIGERVRIERDNEGIGTKVYIVNKRKEVLLADMGYGVSQVLPVILQICITAVENKGVSSQLFLEEPEANLHPALQSKLADMFVDAMQQFNIQFIIETHSEYIIRKLQYLTARDVIKPSATCIQYFYPPDNIPQGEKQVKKINIDENGVLSDDFGTGFFDEADNIAISIWNMNHSQKN